MTTTVTAGTRILPNSVTDRYARLAWIFQAVAEGGNQDLYMDAAHNDLAYAPDPSALEGDWVEIRYPYGFAGVETVRGDVVLSWEYTYWDDGTDPKEGAAMFISKTKFQFLPYLLYTPDRGWSWENGGDTTERRYTDDPRHLAGLIELMEGEFFEVASR